TTGHFPTDTFTSSGGDTYILSKAPATLGSIEVSVQGVLQAVSAYTINGTELRLVGVANDDVIFVRHLGETLLVPVPVDDSVTTAKLADNAVDGTKLADNAVDGTKIADNTINSDHYVDGSVDNVHLATGIDAGKLINALPQTLGTDSIIRTNAKTISENITFAGTENGMTAGPITIANNCSVVVTNGSSWTIV
ncbi:MAG: hypothetical protein QGH83_06845, partial [Candidatus Pacebacteria bacterium]|nr:hypothetical protein [Candidatus Paceibacterota bacterium]